MNDFLIICGKFGGLIDHRRNYKIREKKGTTSKTQRQM